jgi:response regulator RpfG family c-di-GMP phosphodiesterase
MRRPIRKRGLLVLLLSVGQFICLTLAVLWFANLVNRSVHRIVREWILESSVQFAALMTNLIGEMGLTDVRPGTEDWQRLQRIVETARLPNEGYLCIIDADTGDILCHPDYREPGTTTAASLNGVVLHHPLGDQPIVQPAGYGKDAPYAAVGWADFPDGRYFIAARALPALGIQVVAYQRAESVAGVIDEFTGRIRMIGIGVTVGLTILLAMTTYSIVNRYENRMAYINENLEELVQKRSRALLQSRSAVILGLAKLAESRDDETGRHLERIRRYVEILGRYMLRKHPEVNRDFADTIVETSALHDIGKVGVPDQVLLKAGPLTDDEREQIKRHTTIGGDTLLAVKQRWGDDTFLVTACEIAFAHHERWDGGGYPFGLKGDMIPLSARIVALADVYDALTTKRVYKEAMSHDAARDAIVSASGAQFDPDVVDAFVATEDQFRAVRDELGE